MKFILASTMAGLVALAGCSPTDRNPSDDSPVAAATNEGATGAQEGPGAYRGGAVAAQVCAQCHDIGNGSRPLIDVGAPAFREVAGRAGTSAEGLETWMRTSHPAMPNFIFSGQEVTDLAEYISNLAKHAE